VALAEIAPDLLTGRFRVIFCYKGFIIVVPQNATSGAILCSDQPAWLSERHRSIWTSVRCLYPDGGLIWSMLWIQ